MNKALIVVDVQRFFLHDAPSTLPVKIADEIAKGSYSAVAFTVFKNTTDSNFSRSLKWDKCCAQNDIELPADFSPYIHTDNVFERHTYSGFNGTQLHEYLQKNTIEQLVLCGVDTDACVLATAFSAFDLGYRVDVNFELTFSGGDLEEEAQAILRRSIIART